MSVTRFESGLLHVTEVPWHSVEPGMTSATVWIHYVGGQHEWFALDRIEIAIARRATTIAVFGGIRPSNEQDAYPAIAVHGKVEVPVPAGFDLRAVVDSVG